MWSQFHLYPLQRILEVGVQWRGSPTKIYVKIIRCDFSIFITNFPKRPTRQCICNRILLTRHIDHMYIYVIMGCLQPQCMEAPVQKLIPCSPRLTYIDRTLIVTTNQHNSILPQMAPHFDGNDNIVQLCESLT